MKTNESLNRFFRIYTESAARNGTLRIAIMRIGGQPVAVQLLVDSARRLWILKIGYDETYARSSPGTLLMNYVLQYVFEGGYEGFEMLGRDEQWLKIWPHEVHEFKNYVCNATSLPAIIGRRLEMSGKGVKAMQRILAKENNGTALWSIAKKAVQHFIPHHKSAEQT